MPLQHLDPLLLSVFHANPGNSPATRRSFGVRTVEVFEFDYILSGDGEIVTDGVPIPTRSGTLFFRWPGMVVEGIAPYSCYFVRFLPDGGAEGHPDSAAARRAACREPLPDWREQLPFPAVLHVRDVGAMTRLFADLHRSHYVAGPAGVLASRILLMQILLAVHELDRHDETTAPGRTSIESRILAVAERIEADPRSPRTLASLSAEAGYSRFFFCRRFRELVGEPPMEFWNRMRVLAAQKLLVETSEPVSSLFARCGFESEENFYRQFRKFTRTTPRTYRLRNTGRAR